MVRMITWSEVLPGNVQYRTGTPQAVTAMPMTTWGRSRSASSSEAGGSASLRGPRPLWQTVATAQAVRVRQAIMARHLGGGDVPCRRAVNDNPTGQHDNVVSKGDGP
jgi:hypothetical protein